MLPRYVVLLPLIALLATTERALGDESDLAADEAALRAAHIPTGGAELLAFFRKRTPSDATRSRIRELIDQLGDDSFALRQRASAELLSMGSGAVAPLRKAARHSDLEIRRRARQALTDILRDSDPDVLATAVRVLGRRKPATTVAVLLAYLPCAEDALVADEVDAALASAGVVDGKVDPLLTRALTDELAVKRGAAGIALCRAGGREQRVAVRRLLRDPDSVVRQRIAFALVEAHDKAAVPVLIALLTDLPQADAERVEDLLHLLAGEYAPRGDLDGDSAARRKYRQSWADWWTRRGGEIDLTKIPGLGRPLGHTLIAQLDLPGTDGRILELDARGRTRWQIGDLQYPIDAQVIDSRRILVAEYRAQRVTERDHKGAILWQTQVDSYPVAARRLANGNTFIATRGRVYEVDRKGVEVWTLNQPFGFVAAACPLRDGTVAVISNTGVFQRLDRKGNVRKTFRVNRIVRSIGTHIDALPNGHVVVPFYTGNCVVEYDADGKSVWTAQAYRPTSAQRLPNGHTIVSSRASNTIVEVDRKGVEVWSHRCDGRPMCVRRR